jgi:uncharacterized protein (TIGR02246 family)
VSASSPEAIVQAQLDAYNRQDLEAHCACFADDVVVADVGGAVRLTGKDAYRELYRKVFADFPENHARVVHRIVLGDRVIDHEDVSRGPQGPRFEVAAIYTVRNGLIARVDFVRAG